MKEIINLFKPYFDKEYAIFQAKLAPSIDPKSCLGVRIPDCRKVAKEIKGTPLEEAFLNELPHLYYDENMLHSILISGISSFDKALKETIKFLPYVDNWATSDTLHSKGLSKDKKTLMTYILKWIKSKHTYTVRFGVDCLMTYFLDEDFSNEHLDIVGSIKSEEYYINMMIAWYFATALVKQYDETIKYIESKQLSTWVQNKTIQKAKESFRISKQQKEYLETLKK